MFVATLDSGYLASGGEGGVRIAVTPLEEMTRILREERLYIGEEGVTIPIYSIL